MPSSDKHTPQFSYQFLHPKYWGIWLGVGILKTLNLLPYHTKYRLGAWLGKTLKKFAKRRSAIARANLKIAFPDKTDAEREAILTEHFASLGISLFESMIVWWGHHRQPNRPQFEPGLVTYEGLSHLQNAQNANKGVIILVPHFTTTDIIGLFLSFKTQLKPVYRPHDNPLMDYLIFKGRTLDNMQPLSKLNLRGMINTLKHHENLGFLPDQRYGAKGHINVPFFGVEAQSNPATSKLAKLTGCLVLPTFLTRNADHSYHLKFLPPIENFPGASDYDDTLRLHQLYEAEIQKNPSQYLWVHNRWGIKL